jgi:hypothetical protein
MAFVDPINHPRDPILRCFNSQLPAGQATSGNCGIGFLRNAAGAYLLSFNFQVSDRFYSATSASGGLGMIAAPANQNNQLHVLSYDWLDQHLKDDEFSILVY